MYAKRFTHVVTSLILALAALLLSACGPTPAPPDAPLEADTATPEATVERFYRWYLGYPGNVMVTGAYRSSEYLTDEFVQQVDATLASFRASNQPGGYDPFLCAQDIPAEFTVEAATISGTEATIQFHGIWNPGTQHEQRNDVTIRLRQVGEQWKIDGIACARPEVADPLPPAAPQEPDPAPLPDPLEYTPVALPDLGLTLDVPASWQRLEPEWAWSPSSDGQVGIVGVHWTVLQPPAEPEAALLPNHAQVVDSTPVEFPWGSGRRVTLQVYAPAAQSGDEQAPVQAVEQHVLTTLSLDETRYGVALYASAKSVEQLTNLEPVFQHMLNSVTLPQVAPSASTEQDAGQTANWQTFQDMEYGYTLRYPQDWAYQELSVTGPGMPDDFPIQRMLIFFPAAMAESLGNEGGGPPDPNQPPVIAPLHLQVCLGDETELRRAFSEPTTVETREVNGTPMVYEESAITAEIAEIRYIFQHPHNPDLRVVFSDAMTGFPERAAGSETVMTTMQLILSTFAFSQ